MLLLLYIAVQLHCLSQAERWAAAGPPAGPQLYPRISRMQRHGFGLAGGGRPDLNNGLAAFLRSRTVHAYLIGYLLDLQGIHQPSFQSSSTVAVSVTKPFLLK